MLLDDDDGLTDWLIQIHSMMKFWVWERAKGAKRKCFLILFCFTVPIRGQFHDDGGGGDVFKFLLSSSIDVAVTWNGQME